MALGPVGQIYFTVPEIETEHARLTEAGIDFLDKPHVVHREGASELWMAFFRDPDGHHLGLMEQRAALADPALALLAPRRGVDQLDVTAPPALRPFVAAAIDAPVLAVTATTREAEDLAAALESLVPPSLVAVYPAWETL